MCRRKGIDGIVQFYNGLTSPWLRGIMVALAIFSSIRSNIPVLSSDALINMPELIEKEVGVNNMFNLT